MENYSISDYEIIKKKQVVINLVYMKKKKMVVFYYHITWCLIVITAKVTHQKISYLYY